MDLMIGIIISLLVLVSFFAFKQTNSHEHHHRPRQHDKRVARWRHQRQRTRGGGILLMIAVHLSRERRNHILADLHRLWLWEREREKYRRKYISYQANSHPNEITTMYGIPPVVVVVEVVVVVVVVVDVVGLNRVHWLRVSPHRSVCKTNFGRCREMASPCPWVALDDLHFLRLKITIDGKYCFVRRNVSSGARIISGSGWRPTGAMPSLFGK